MGWFLENKILKRYTHIAILLKHEVVRCLFVCLRDGDKLPSQIFKDNANPILFRGVNGMDIRRFLRTYFICTCTSALYDP